MTFFSWSDAYSVGAQFIDNDHRRLVEMINALHDAMTLGKERDILGKTLDDLIQYTKEHFKREEDEMRRIDYHAAAEHLAQHERLIREVADLQAKFHAGESLVTGAVLKFLKDWLVNHIMRTDIKFASALRRAGAAPVAV